MSAFTFGVDALAGGLLACLILIAIAQLVRWLVTWRYGR